MHVAVDLFDVYSRVDGFQIIEPNIEHVVPQRELDSRPVRALLSKHGPLRVLLAEDDPDTGRLMAHILQKVGMEVTRADDGEEALRYALSSQEKGSPFDVVLMDLQMPKLDGYSAASTLRYKGYSGPIIALTGRPLDEDHNIYKEAGCNYFIVKSEVHKKLLRLISRCVGH